MSRYPDLEAYGLIGDGHSAALVSTSGCVDWMCLPRIDSPSVFARLLDWDHGGHLTLAPTVDFEVERRYLPGTMVLETTFRTDRGRVVMLDCFAMRRGGRDNPYRQMLRVVEGIEGVVPMQLEIAPHLEYATVQPLVRDLGSGLLSAVGGRTGLLISTDVEAARKDRHEIVATFDLGEGERRRVSVEWLPPDRLEVVDDPTSSIDSVDDRLSQTIEWWGRWSESASGDGIDGDAVRSGAVLKAMINAPTGAMVAAPTTSLPETVGGERNWDYRFSWVRDSVFAMRALTEMGMTSEADGFRRFVQRTTGGRAAEVGVVYGIGGEHRLTEVRLDHLEGWRGSRPVRIGNGAQGQLQLDTFGHVIDLSRRWVEHGGRPDDDEWLLLCETADLICETWTEPDQGIWEIRGEPRHFVHSKVMCWAGLDGAIAMATSLGRSSSDRWRSERERIRRAVMDRGIDPATGGFRAAFDRPGLDAATLLIPTVGFVEWDAPVMRRTIDGVRAELDLGNGLLLRYDTDDGLEGREGVFLACSFWLVEALARSGRIDEAEAVFAEVCSVSNDLGLFAEEYDPASKRLLGNFPQALSHLAYVTARLALSECAG